MGDEETKSLIRSCLISTKGSLSLRELKRDFQTLVGYPIPFRDSGFRSLEDYLRSIPDVVRLNDSGPEPLVQFVADASTAGIASLVQRQKATKKKAPPPRRPTGYVPRSNYGANKRPGGFSAPRFDLQPRRTYNVRPNSGARPGLLPTPGPRPRWSQPSAARPPAPASWGQPSKPQHQQAKPPSQAPVARPPSQTQQAKPAAPQPARSPPQQQPKQQPKQQAKQQVKHQVKQQAKQQAKQRSTPAVQPSVFEPQVASAASAQSWWGPPAAETSPAPAPPAQTGTLTPKQELQNYIRQHRLPEAKLETVSFRPKSKSASRIASFYSTITVGDVRCQTYPAESPSAELAEDAACQMALDELRQKQEQDSSRRESPITADEQLIISRIGQMLETRRYGLWRDSVPDEYRRLYQERVPDHWEDLLYSSGTVQFDCVGADRYILYSATNVMGAGDTGGAGDGSTSRKTPSPSADCLTRLETVPLPEEDMFPVLVIWVLSGSQLAFRLIGEQYTDRLDDLQSEMEVSLLEEKRPVNPVIGGIYLAQIDGTPHRVQVMDILDDMVSAFFVDIGDTELVAAGSLAPLDAARFGQLPGQALHATLSGVDGERPGAKEALSRLVLRKSLICQVVEADDNRLEVVLFDTSGEDDVNINQKLRETAEAGAPPSLPPAGGIVDAFVVHVSRPGGVVFVQLDSSAADEVCDRVLAAGQVAAREPPPAAVTPGQLLLARYSDGNWYRARVLAPPQPDRVSVLFIDYGNEEWVPSSELRVPPPSLGSHPAQAVAVRLSGVQMSDGAALRLMEMVPMDGTRVVLRVTSRPATDTPEVEAYKRLDNNELVSINATLSVEAQMSSRPTVGRQASVPSSAAAPSGPPPPRQSSQPFLAAPAAPAATPAAAPAAALAAAPAAAPTAAPAAAAVAQQRSTSPTEQLQRLRVAESGPVTPAGLEPIEQYRVQRDGDGYLDVTVSFCSSPWNIYVQPYLEGSKLSTLMASMQQYYADPANLRSLTPADVSSGQFCAVKNPDDAIWYRARVETRLDNGQVTIKFVDFGDFSYVPLAPASVQPLPAVFRTLPAQAVKARLGGVRPAGSDWTIDDCIALQRLLNAGSGTFVAELLELSVDTITGEQLIIVRLVDTSGETDVYVDRVLVEAGNAVHTGQYYAS